MFLLDIYVFVGVLLCLVLRVEECAETRGVLFVIVEGKCLGCPDHFLRSFFVLIGGILVECRYLEAVIVKHGRRIPVAVECEEGQHEVALLALVGALEVHIALYVHAVFEVFVDISLVRRRKGYGCLYLGRSACRNREVTALGNRLAVYLPLRNVLEKVRLFGYGQSVSRQSFGHNQALGAEGQRLVAEVLDIEYDVIFARLFLVRAEFGLGSAIGSRIGVDYHVILCLGVEVSLGGEGVCEGRKTCALLSGRVGKFVLIIYERRRAHQNLIGEVGELHVAVEQRGMRFLEILSQKRRETCEVGRCH